MAKYDRAIFLNMFIQADARSCPRDYAGQSEILTSQSKELAEIVQKFLAKVLAPSPSAQEVFVMPFVTLLGKPH